MSLDVSALTTLSTVKDELGGPTGQDSTLERYIAEASDLFRKLTGREWYKRTEYVERVPGYRKKRLVVYDHLPLIQIRKIELKIDDQWDEVPSGAYQIEDKDAGFIRRVDGAAWQETQSYYENIEPQRTGENLKLYRVTYDGGYVTPEQASQTGDTRDLPHDIEAAVIDLVATKYTNKGSGSGIDSESIMSVSIDYSNTAQMSGVISGTTPKFSSVVRQYRNPKTLIA